jgi:hypothetical protein
MIHFCFSSLGGRTTGAESDRSTIAQAEDAGNIRTRTVKTVRVTGSVFFQDKIGIGAHDRAQGRLETVLAIRTNSGFGIVTERLISRFLGQTGPSDDGHVRAETRVPLNGGFRAAGKPD